MNFAVVDLMTISSKENANSHREWGICALKRAKVNSHISRKDVAQHCSGERECMKFLSIPGGFPRYRSIESIRKVGQSPLTPRHPQKDRKSPQNPGYCQTPHISHTNLRSLPNSFLRHIPNRQDGFKSPIRCQLSSSNRSIRITHHSTKEVHVLQPLHQLFLCQP
jgi:hypothetical protein